MIRPIRFGAFCAAAALLLSAAIGFPGHADNGKVFDRAWSLVEKRYWDRTMHHLDWESVRDRYYPRAVAAPDTQHLYAVINEMLALLGDSHVYATSPTRLAYERGKFDGDSAAGFGFDAVQIQGQWVIQSIAHPGPAATAGIQIGWKLISIDGQPIDIDRHFGAGDIATIVLEDEHGVRHTMALKGVTLPDEPDRRAVRSSDGILTLAFDQFDKGDDRWVARELAEQPAPAGVILDLRENGGGDADILDRIAGQFVGDRQVILRLIAKRTIEEQTSGAGPRSYRGPLAILVGPRTASAAEVLTAFLDETGRAVTVGEKTAGAATGGVDHDLPDGGQLSIAEYDLQTANGTRLEGRGFAPRHQVIPTLAQLRRGEDPAWERARALIAGGERATR
ncbi:MAG: peptidase [Rhizorhabdus sp.]|nr:peptidase [Rhizorhabdus sp.]